jgi:hypothetical protein
MSRAERPITALLVAVLLLTPFVWASTAETWTHGIYDYESDEILQVVGQKDVAPVPSSLSLNLNGALVIVGLLALSDQTSAIDVLLPAPQTRGPPLS